MMGKLFGFLKTGAAVAAIAATATAQVPDAPASKPAPSPAPAANASASGAPAASPSPTPASSNSQSGFLGGSMPFLNPGNEVLTWDGKTWNINNNRLFESRFEKYLSAPEETSANDQAYRAVIQAITEKLAPGMETTKSLDEAFAMLPKAARFDIDAHLCDGIADAVYASWQAMRNTQRLEAATAALDKERRLYEWYNRVDAPVMLNRTGVKGAPNGATPPPAPSDYSSKGPYAVRWSEANTAMKFNQAKQELVQFQMRIEFQTLLVQLFVQRRFQHVIIASRFYRSVFTDGDTTLKVGSDTKNLFSKSTGAPPTVATLDSLSNEAIRDAREGVQSYEFLLGQNELESATKRLAEAFLVGEYLPELRTLPREKKRKALDFAQKSNQLLSALEVKDYGRAEKLVKGLEETAKDFDNSKPMAAIETAKTVSAMHLAKARNAAVSGDKTTLESELREATEIWPRNPALAEVSGRIFESADVQQKALADLEQLLAQHNFRQISDDKVRFLTAVALFPDRQEKLKKVLEAMQEIESTVIRSGEIAKRGDYAGAWEQVEQTFQKFPEDNKLNQVRANLTTEAAEFVRTLRMAQELEKKGQVGSSLAWFLKAQKLYPATEFGKAGIDRLVKMVLPEE